VGDSDRLLRSFFTCTVDQTHPAGRSANLGRRSSDQKFRNEAVQLKIMRSSWKILFKELLRNLQTISKILES
jgi:hypothetical protein